MRRELLFAGAMVWIAGAWAQQAASPPLPSTSNTRPGAPVIEGPEIQSPRPAEPALADSLDLIEKRQYPEAAQKIQTYLRDHPESPAAHFLLGYALYREEKPRESLAEYTAAAHLRNPAANDLAVVAMDYILLHDYSDADKWLTQASAWAPADELYLYYLGRTKYSESHFQEAIDIFRKCLILSPRDLRAEYNLGLADEGLGHNDEAAAAYRIAIEWQRNAAAQDPQPYLDLGMLLLAEDKLDEALPMLEKAVTLGPRNPRAHEQLGQAWERLQNLQRADVEMQAAVSLAPDISSLHFEMGKIYQREGFKEKAKAEFERCAALNATHSTDAAPTPNPPPHD